MRITGLGHASLYIETAHGTVLTDPWVNPAYFGSWFPFPDNSELDWDRFGAADYLFVSHLHRDHFDDEQLRRHVDKRATVLLPEYPTTQLRDQLADLGFTRFVQTVSEEVVELDGLRVMVQSLVSPTDGPIGDSSLWLDDGRQRLLNQNDARPRNLDAFRELGPVDAHLLQFSGAIWYPMVYQMPERGKQALGRAKRARQFDRTLRYIDDLRAGYVFPIAGPPCFLDPELWHLNDIFDDPSNIFPDQAVFLRWLAEQGHPEGRLLLPGSVARLDRPDCPVVHPYPPERVFGSAAAKAAYLRQLQRRRGGEIDALRAGWAHPGLDLLASLQSWLTPLLAQTERIAAGIPSGIRMLAEDADRGDVDLLIDLSERSVRTYRGEPVRYSFRTRRAYLEQLVASHEVDWVNSLFLSCRFSARRIGPYNEYVYTFFKCLSDERLNYAEAYFAESDVTAAAEEIELDGWVLQRRCPHLKADLSRFGVIEGGVLTCQMHGWRWQLDRGRCLTAAGHEIRARSAEAAHRDDPVDDDRAESAATGA